MIRTLTLALTVAVLALPAAAKFSAMPKLHHPVMLGESTATDVKELQREVSALDQRVSVLEQEVNAGRLPGAMLPGNNGLQSPAGSGGNLQTPATMAHRKNRGP
jgi:hypothetical protein